ncbi:SPFH/Band 7/PHB domain protein, partial [Streptomyces sp. NPDC019531]
NNFWVIPSEITSALQGVSRAFTEVLPQSPATREKPSDDSAERAADDTAQAAQAAAAALADAAEADRATPGVLPSRTSVDGG